MGIFIDMGFFSQDNGIGRMSSGRAVIPEVIQMQSCFLKIFIFSMSNEESPSSFLLFPSLPADNK